MTDEELIRLALEEDIGDGDFSSLSTISEKKAGRAELLVKEEGILAGIEVADMVYRCVNPEIDLYVLMNDGALIKNGDVPFRVEGPAISLLAAERTVLNFLQRMSGIATQTRKYVDAIKGLHTVILDTRKTTPNMRRFEKYAVKIGGGENHRMGLYDMIMIKDNHIDISGGIRNAIKAANFYLKKNNKNLRIEIEVRNINELKQVLAEGNVHRIMFDNFSPETLAEAVQLTGNIYETEASGGITLENVRKYAETGVDFISVGALTHHIKSLDMSLKSIN